MADLYLNQLPDASVLTGSEYILVEQAGAAKKTTAQAVANRFPLNPPPGGKRDIPYNGGSGSFSASPGFFSFDFDGTGPVGASGVLYLRDPQSLTNGSLALYDEFFGQYGCLSFSTGYWGFGNVGGGVGSILGGIKCATIIVGADNGLWLSGQTDGAGGGVGTILNAPSGGDPVFWVPIVVNGSIRHFPVW